MTIYINEKFTNYSILTTCTSLNLVVRLSTVRLILNLTDKLTPSPTLVNTSPLPPLLSYKPICAVCTPPLFPKIGQLFVLTVSSSLLEITPLPPAGPPTPYNTSLYARREANFFPPFFGFKRGHWLSASYKVSGGTLPPLSL